MEERLVRRWGLALGKGTLIFLGFFFLFLGFVGIFLPLLPTTPFLLLTAFFFSMSSERFHDWLIEHKTFGPIIVDWRERGAISQSNKTMATVTLGLLLTVPHFFVSVPAVAVWINLVVAVGVLGFIWSRPS